MLAHWAEKSAGAEGDQRPRSPCMPCAPLSGTHAGQELLHFDLETATFTCKRSGGRENLRRSRARFGRAFVDVSDVARHLQRPCAACCTLRAISWVAAPCSSTAAAIALAISDRRLIVALISLIAATESMVADCIPAICPEISSVAFAVCAASAFSRDAARLLHLARNLADRAGHLFGSRGDSRTPPPRPPRPRPQAADRSRRCALTYWLPPRVPSKSTRPCRRWRRLPTGSRRQACASPPASLLRRVVRPLFLLALARGRELTGLKTRGAQGRATRVFLFVVGSRCADPPETRLELSNALAPG